MDQAGQVMEDQAGADLGRAKGRCSLCDWIVAVLELIPVRPDVLRWNDYADKLLHTFTWESTYTKDCKVVTQIEFTTTALSQPNAHVNLPMIATSSAARWLTTPQMGIPSARWPCATPEVQSFGGHQLRVYHRLSPKDTSENCRLSGVHTREAPGRGPLSSPKIAWLYCTTKMQWRLRSSCAHGVLEAQTMPRIYSLRKTFGSSTGPGPTAMSQTPLCWKPRQLESQ